MPTEISKNDLKYLILDLTNELPELSEKWAEINTSFNGCSDNVGAQQVADVVELVAEGLGAVYGEGVRLRRKVKERIDSLGLRKGEVNLKKLKSVIPKAVAGILPSTPRTGNFGRSIFPKR